jgi:hypothetical protein
LFADQHVHCEAAVVLEELGSCGALRQFLAIKDKDREGDCHDVVVALSADLKAAGVASGWYWHSGIISFDGRDILHSWLEFAGWAVDGVTRLGRKHDVLIMPSAYYQETHGPRDIRSVEITLDPNPYDHVLKNRTVDGVFYGDHQ